MSATTAGTIERPSIGGIARRALTAAVASAVVNAALWLIGIALLGVSSEFAGFLMPIISVSVMGAVGGAVVYALLSRLTGNAKTIFTVIAVVVLLLSMFPVISAASGTMPPMEMPIPLPPFTGAVPWLLGLMHVTTAAFTVYFLTRD